MAGPIFLKVEFQHIERWACALFMLQAQRALVWGAMLEIKIIHKPSPNSLSFWGGWFLTLNSTLRLIMAKKILKPDIVSKIGS